jgi:hypothetical protein
MAKPHDREAGVPHGGGYDSELDVKTIVGFAVGLAVFTLVVLAVMWWMSGFFKREEEAKDTPPSPLVEARGDPIPPGPRLRAAPPRDLADLRARDDEMLTTYGWVDKSRGVARIPVDRAMSILVDKGLGPNTQKKREVK